MGNSSTPLEKLQVEDIVNGNIYEENVEGGSFSSHSTTENKQNNQELARLPNILEKLMQQKRMSEEEVKTQASTSFSSGRRTKPNSESENFDFVKRQDY